MYISLLVYLQQYAADLCLREVSGEDNIEGNDQFLASSKCRRLPFRVWFQHEGSILIRDFKVWKRFVWVLINSDYKISVCLVTWLSSGITSTILHASERERWDWIIEVFQVARSLKIYRWVKLNLLKKQKRSLLTILLSRRYGCGLTVTQCQSNSVVLCSIEDYYVSSFWDASAINRAYG